MMAPLVIAISCEGLFVVEIRHECVVAEIRLEEDVCETKLIDFVADLFVFVFCKSPVQKVLLRAGGNGRELAHDGNRQFRAEVVIKPFQNLKGVLYKSRQDEMADHDAARSRDFSRFVKWPQKTNGVNKIADGVPRDCRIVRRMDATLGQIRIGEFEIRQKDVDELRLLFQHFHAGVARTVPDERQIGMVFANGFAELLDVRPPMLRRHEIEIVDAFRD